MAATARREALTAARRTGSCPGRPPSGASSVSRTAPPAKTATRTATYTIDPARIERQTKPCCPAQLATAANQVTRKVMPQMPVTDASCINGRSPYCVLASELMTPVGPNDSRYSTLTAAQGNTNVAVNPWEREKTKRSAA